MAVTIKHLPHSEVEVAGEVSAQDLEGAWEKAVKEAVAETELPGFRKGKAPGEMVTRKIGEDRLLHRAAEFALGQAWPKAIEEAGVQAIGLPDIQILKLARGNPLEWKARVAVLPEVVLPAYQDIARGMRAPLEKVLTGRAGFLEKSMEEDGKNENKTEKDSPERIKEKQRLTLLEAIATQSSIELPAVLKEAEKIKMAQELRAGLEAIGLKWEDYLAHIKKNEQEILDGFDGEADKRARFGLVLREIAKREHIDPSPQEVEERVRQMLPAYAPEEQKHLDKNRLESYAYGIIRNGKVFELLESL